LPFRKCFKGIQGPFVFIFEQANDDCSGEFDGSVEGQVKGPSHAHDIGGLSEIASEVDADYSAEAWP
jgi:hypothetical protein